MQYVGLLDKTQMDNIYKIQKDYTQIPAIKDANKISSLLVSLKNLAAQRKVTDPTKSSGVAEFAMIYKFMKSLDETSTCNHNTPLNWMTSSSALCYYSKYANVFFFVK